jgi:hypothetical protein
LEAVARGSSRFVPTSAERQTMGFGFCPAVVLGLVFFNDGLVQKTVAHAKLADEMIVN